jgi:LysM repeat protein
MTHNSLIHIRKLTIALIISGALNIALAGLFFYWIIKERPPTPYYELKPAATQEQQGSLATDKNSAELIEEFKQISFESLLNALTNSQHVENGYTQRDIALASLVAFHHFDLERALAHWPLPSQKRTIIYYRHKDGQKIPLNIYPGLTEIHFKEILSFIQTERWPFKNKGLFLMLQKKQDPSLVDAFCITPEFLSVELLFARGEYAVDKTELLQMLLEGDWNHLSAFAEHQKASQDLSNPHRQRFLLDYIEKNSKTAAHLLLKIEGNSASIRLDDAHVILLLDLLQDKTPEAEQFAINLLTSPRSDAVWQKAAAQLYRYAGEPFPEKYQHHAALKRFITYQKETAAAPQKIDLEKPKMSPPPLTQPTKPKLTAPAAISVRPPLVPTNPKKSVIAESKPIPHPLPNKRPLISSIPHRLPSSLKAAESTYIVQEGDSLWKIAKRYNLDINKLRSYNQLDNDTLKPGKTLRIPSQ